MKYNHITELIGNTPLLKIDERIHGLKNVNLYAKLEYYNPFGSVKDRIAFATIADDIADIQKNKKIIVEASSGNTAKALSALASIYDSTLYTVTNRMKVHEVKDILHVMGATIHEMPGKSECPDPTTQEDDPLSYIDRMVQQHPEKYFYTRQYTNEKNIEAHYKTTGREILDDLGSVDYFFGGLGTTGSTRGAAQYIADQGQPIKTIGIVSAQSDFIPGIRNEDELWEVGLFVRKFYDDIVTINAQDGLDGMLTLIRKCGILAGPTSGAAFAAGVRYLQSIDSQLSEKKNAVFIACDRFEPYISYIKKRRPALFGISDAPTELPFDEKELQDVPEITLEQSQGWINNTSPLIIDIRTPAAYNAGHIKRSINIEREKLEEMIKKSIPFSLEHDILFVCPVGDQSKRYAAELIRQGYRSYSLGGGLIKWRDSGMALERSYRKQQ